MIMHNEHVERARKA